MSGWRSYILLGGGNLAVEVASYLVDLRAACANAGEAGTDRPVVSDVVAPGKPRLEDICRVTGDSPRMHETVSSLENVDEKLAIVCNGDSAVRRRVFSEATAAGLRMGQVIHPSAWISSTASIGPGVIICPFVFVGPFAAIGDNVALNVHATIGHDAVLDHSSVISPGAELNGFSRTGVASFVGAGAVLHPHAALGAYSKLSAGSVLTKAVGDGYIMHGNPAVGRQMIAIPATEGV